LRSSTRKIFEPEWDHLMPKFLLLLSALLLYLSCAKNLPAEVFIAQEYLAPDGSKMPYRLLVPEHYDARRKYPVVLFFHGLSDRGYDNVSQLSKGVRSFATPENLQRFPCFVVVPQCPPDDGWVDLAWGATPGAPRPLEPRPALLHALKCVDQVAAAYSTDPSRLYVTGLSVGGFATWDCLTRFPGRFAAAVVVCGGGDEHTVTAAVARVPVWIFHSADDPVVPLKRALGMIAAMRKAGGNPRFTEFQGLGHDSWDRAYTEPGLLPWLFAQRLERSTH
jgi:predicted peptidase